MKDRLKHLWDSILERVSTEVNAQSFQTWFKPTRLVSCENGRLVIEGPNPFFVDWLVEHHRQKIERAARETLGEPVSVDFVSPASPPRVSPPEASATRSMIENEPVVVPENAQLNARYVFDEFVVGSSNRFAHAAALAVADNPARAYNPLFIYGGAGLGKTHLIQAIGHRVIEKHAKMRISYVSAEGFMNDLILAIRSGITHEFKDRYRNIDILLIDDVHFLAGKESTQEEFFFTFNALHNANKQIVVTSDRPPKEIPTLQERLTSRFEWGLIADIQPPDTETRIAILRKKVEKEHIQIPDDVIQLVAENAKSNIRELEGSLIKLLAYSSLTSREITADMARDVLADMVKNGAPKKIAVQTIQKAVAQHFDIPIDSLRAKTRIARVVIARQVGIYLSRELTDLSLVDIGKRFGGRDHSTVLHAIARVKQELDRDASLRRKVQALLEELSA
ncbi:MAG: chromosomal replication initiator protein DnaA [Candidatus Krumholzibacteria bacterium]|nr:chromosomal replication initiator protein DnaA [Candidatus Krumholzibacteria bacterium]